MARVQLEGMAQYLFANIQGLEYINYYLVDKYKFYIKGNVVLSREVEEYLKDYIIPILYETIINQIPSAIFDEAGIIAIRNGEIRCCHLNTI